MSQVPAHVLAKMDQELSQGADNLDRVVKIYQRHLASGMEQPVALGHVLLGIERDIAVSPSPYWAMQALLQMLSIAIMREAAK